MDSLDFTTERWDYDPEQHTTTPHYSDAEFADYASGFSIFIPTELGRVNIA